MSRMLYGLKPDYTALADLPLEAPNPSDDPRELAAELSPGVRGIGLSSRGEQAATVRAGQLSLDAGGIAFELTIEDQSHALQSKLLGRFNVDNLLAVAGALHALGDAPADIARTLTATAPPSSAAVAESLAATGASFTAVTETVTVAVLVPPLPSLMV